MKNSTKKNKKTAAKNLWYRNKYFYLIVLAIFVAIVYFLFFRNPAEPQFVKEGEVTFLKKENKQLIKKIDVEVARNHDEQMQGMMYRTHMDDDKGMLFIYPGESRLGFWMKNTLIPLDIAYIDSKGVIDTIFRNAAPLDSINTMYARRKVQFVVEVFGGWSDKYGVKEDDMIEFKVGK